MTYKWGMCCSLLSDKFIVIYYVLFTSFSSLTFTFLSSPVIINLPVWHREMSHVSILFNTLFVGDSLERGNMFAGFQHTQVAISWSWDGF